MKRGSLAPRRCPSTWLWLTAAALLLAFPIRFWTKPLGRAGLGVAANPVERTNPQLEAAWTFLSQAAAVVPPGATYTVRAANPEAEMEAFMVAIGPLRHARALPSSYYCQPLPDLGGQAEYVLALAGTPDLSPGLEPVARFELGTVFRRGARR